MRKGLVKCLGKQLDTVEAGSEVKLHRKAERDPDNLREYPNDADLFGLPADLTDFQVMMRREGDGPFSYVIVRNNRIDSWADEPAADLPKISNSGLASEPATGRPGVERVEAEAP